MNKLNQMLLLSIISIFFLTGCNVYNGLYGEDAEFLPLDDISSEIEKTLEEVLPTEVEEGGEAELIEIDIEDEKKSQCNDKIDNDEDGFIDYPNDFGCENSGDNNEINDGEFKCNNGIDDDKDDFVDERDPGCNDFRKERGMEEIKVEEPKPLEEAIALTVQETDFVSLITEAEDPDKDILTFTYSNPLNEEGQWKTNYGDAGEYTVAITASDGKLTTSKDVLIIVLKKEETPTIDSFKPEETAITIKETEKIDFGIKASDLNKDELTYSWKLDGDKVSSDNSYAFETTYDDSGSHTVKAEVSDETGAASQLWSVTVENVNRKPIMEKISTINVKETEIVTINLKASDPDNNEISFSISGPVGDDGVWETTYEDAGRYTVAIVASDGEDSVSQDVTIVVENVNRPPVITGIISG